MWRRPLGALTVIALFAAGCGGDDSGGSGNGDGSIKMWTVYDTADRMAIMENVLADFTKQTGIEVDLSGVSAPDLPQAMVSAAAAGDLPDVVVHGVELASGWVDEGILDSWAASEVIDELGADTFNESALEMVGSEDTEGDYVTVPSDGWGQMIFYRTDLFDAGGAAPPETYDQVLSAAQQLDGQGGARGFALGSTGGDPFTMQVFEHVALANDCHLIGDDDEIALDSPECEEAIQFYVDLHQYAPTGAGDVDTTRANYLAGQAAMMSWSPHLLDELAGLFPDTPLTCDQCGNDQQWLVERTTMLPVLQGPSGDEPTQYGLTINLGITASADTDPSKELVKYLVSDGYMDFLSISPEGRFPMRNGNEPEDTTYVDGWSKLQVGTADNKKMTVGELYGDEAVDTISSSATGFERWGLAEGRGALVTAMYGDLELTNILRDALDGSITPEDAAQQMADSASQLASELS